MINAILMKDIFLQALSFLENIRPGKYAVRLKVRCKRVARPSSQVLWTVGTPTTDCELFVIIVY